VAAAANAVCSYAIYSGERADQLRPIIDRSVSDQRSYNDRADTRRIAGQKRPITDI
jgi:hypothetical protein